MRYHILSQMDLFDYEKIQLSSYSYGIEVIS